jgi:hypothetical protein
MAIRLRVEAEPVRKWQLDTATLRHHTTLQGKVLDMNEVYRHIGQRQRFFDALQHVMSLAPAHSFMASGALYSAGEGARLMGEWLLAEELAHRALLLAREHSSAVVLDRAASLIEDVGERRPGIPTAERNDPRTQVLRELAAEVRLRLSRWRGPTWRPHRAAGDE